MAKVGVLPLDTFVATERAMLLYVSSPLPLPPPFHSLTRVASFLTLAVGYTNDDHMVLGPLSSAEGWMMLRCVVPIYKAGDHQPRINGGRT